MTEFVPKGFYALERAVLLIARELNKALWNHAKMTLAEINAYERLGETTHYKAWASCFELLRRIDVIEKPASSQTTSLQNA